MCVKIHTYIQLQSFDDFFQFYELEKVEIKTQMQFVVYTPGRVIVELQNRITKTELQNRVTCCDVILRVTNSEFIF